MFIFAASSLQKNSVIVYVRNSVQKLQRPNQKISPEPPTLAYEYGYARGDFDFMMRKPCLLNFMGKLQPNCLKIIETVN